MLREGILGMVQQQKAGNAQRAATSAGGLSSRDSDILPRIKGDKLKNENPEQYQKDLESCRIDLDEIPAEGSEERTNVINYVVDKMSQHKEKYQEMPPIQGEIENLGLQFRASSYDEEASYTDEVICKPIDYDEKLDNGESTIDLSDGVARVIKSRETIQPEGYDQVEIVHIEAIRKGSNSLIKEDEYEIVDKSHGPHISNLEQLVTEHHPEVIKYDDDSYFSKEKNAYIQRFGHQEEFTPDADNPYDEAFFDDLEGKAKLVYGFIDEIQNAEKAKLNENPSGWSDLQSVPFAG
jgi:hypothetical protein